MFGDPVIKVEISPDGTKTKVEVENAPDNTCLKLTDSLVKAMGAVTKQVKKPEALREPSVKAGSVKLGGG